MRGLLEMVVTRMATRIVGCSFAMELTFDEVNEPAKDCSRMRQTWAPIERNGYDDSLTTMNAIECMSDDTQIDDDTQKLSDLSIEILIPNAMIFGKYSST